MVDLRFDFRDVFRAGRYAFSGKKMAIHFCGIALWYAIYEILLYISVGISGQIGEFWKEFGLLPVCPWVDFSALSGGLHPLTLTLMGIGFLFAFLIFFVTNTMVSKITLQQMRDDDFYSMRDSAGFVRQQWKTIFGSFIGLVGIFIFCIIWPIFAGLLSKIPAVGNVFLMLASFLMIIAFFVGLLMALVAVVFAVALFFVPAITAATGQDTFESLSQHFSVVWNQPWRLAVYEILLMIWKAICVAVLAALSVLGFVLALWPIRLLVETKFSEIMGWANGWLSGLIEPLAPLFQTTFEVPNAPSTILAIAGMLTALTIIFIFIFVLSYLLSMASAGNTIIYVVLRKRISDENLLEVEEEEEMAPEPTAPEPVTEEAEPEQAPEESPAEAEEQTEQPQEESEKSEEDKSEN